MTDGTRRDLTELLESIGARDGRLVHLQRTPARPAQHSEWPAWADPLLVTAYRHLGVETPWVHQTRAADAVHTGRHTVLATGTGSGKSLAAWLPAISDVLASQGAGPASGPATEITEATEATERRAGGRARIPGSRISEYGRHPTTLYLSPTKALAADQAASLERLVAEVEAIQRADGVPAGSIRTVRIGTCDGDTPLPERDWARAHADVVLTNPDFLHFSLLPGHERWTRFLRSLRYVVIDECHAYRGILGAHVALVLRRLLRLVRRLRPDGPEPVVLCASATAGEPALTAARLIGVEPDAVLAVTDDGAPAGERTLALWQPALREPWLLWDRQNPSTSAHTAAGGASTSRNAGPDTLDPTEDPSARRSAVVEAAELLADLLSVGARALVFVRSRRSAEIVAEHARRILGRSQPELIGAVAAYRGGYLPEERRALEKDLRRGHLRALATTNALELGIDVTGLDAVLIAGWPGTRVSLGQQAGRAGRAGTRGLAVLIASDNPLDAYLVHHPDTVFAAPEATVFDPANPYVLAPHLCSAASEAPLREADLALFGLPDESLLADLAARGALRRRPTGWFWNTSLPGRPQDLTSLRGDGPPEVPVIDSPTGAVIGTVDGAAADSTVHEGAVYIHQGRSYVVTDLTEEAALVTEKAAIGYRTRAREHSSVRIIGERDAQMWGDGIRWSFGSVEVTSQVIGYTELTLPTMEVVAQHELDMPEHVLPTAAVWWTIPADLTQAAGIAPGDLPGALHAAEHASIGMLPLLATCDRWDIGGLSISSHPQTGAPTVFVHDGHAGGAGFAERGYRVGAQWLEATLAVVESCACTAGCPSCVQSPKCGNNNEPLDKAGAITLLRLLTQAAPKAQADSDGEPL
ncbi:DEAD/DEAH box helicase [Actinomyces massiliensis]|uniref:DEAD/DEAH box helicase n=1 Tax=Actinomyces massiliensis TaxID=461393 RepID=UPI0028E5A718|nr:DEAD/DEAH box helicase [Actinomyces massiliensis]